MPRCATLMAFLTVLAAVGQNLALGQDALSKRSSWQVPAPREVKERLDAWLAERSIDEATRHKVDALWQPEPEKGPETLERLADSFALVDPEAKALVQFCRELSPEPLAKDFALLSDEQRDVFLRYNLGLLYGRWLAQHDLYDEVLQQLGQVAPEDVVDPASLLFYQSVAHHRLLNKDECLTTISKLLEQPEAIPRRYATLVRLMEADIRPLETDSLDEVARLMDEVRRRLDLGRAGKRVRQQEDEVIAKLDKMIEQMEQQQQQASASSSGSSGTPGNPLQDSMPIQQKGPGNVDPKELGKKSGWGNLPPKQRQEALQQISQDLPAHYREVIEEYFRKLAQDEGQ